MADPLLQRLRSAADRVAKTVTPAAYPQPQTYLAIVLQEEISKAARAGDNKRLTALDRVREAAGLPRLPAARCTP